MLSKKDEPKEKPFSIKETWLQCIECGARKDLIDERKFRCHCGGLYEVRHHIPSEWNPSEMMEMFDRRAAQAPFYSNNPLISSGVWRFKELIMPYMPIDKIVTLGEGNAVPFPAGDNLRRLVGDVDLFLIDEGDNPTGSFKDDGGTALMSVANLAGAEATTCASTGDTSAMLSAYSAKMGIKCTVILPEELLTAVQGVQPPLYGARTLFIPGTFDDCMMIMEYLVANYGVYPGNSLNPVRIEGHKSTPFRIAQSFHWELPDWIAVPVGNGSNCSSIGKGLQALRDDLELSGDCKPLGCQTEAANPLSRSYKLAKKASHDVTLDGWRSLYQPVKVGKTVATAACIGNPTSREKVMRAIVSFNGAMQEVTEGDLMEAIRACGRDGRFICPQGAMAIAGVRNAFNEGTIDRGEKVVTILTGKGFKFAEAAGRSLQHNSIHSPDCDPETVAKILKL